MLESSSTSNVYFLVYFSYDIMLHCWNQSPLQRPTFTELREQLEKIMTDSSHYLSLDINEENTYYNVASFKSVPSDSEDDDSITNAFDKEKVPILKTIEKLKNEANSDDVKIQLNEPDQPFIINEINQLKADDETFVENTGIESDYLTPKNQNMNKINMMNNKVGYVNMGIDRSQVVL